jgi:Na+-driven multidrug efflux pump
VDREEARRNLTTGLWLGLLAALLFGLTFVAATIYIASP